MISSERKELFHSRTRKEGEHLVSTEARISRGHGILSIDGERVYAHRAAFCIAHNLKLAELESFEIIRDCPRVERVNPDHLFKKPKVKYDVFGR